MIPQEIIESVRERVSLLELASESMTLKRSGRQYMGLCPFHAEKTPSFSINDEEGLFNCFGCGKKGTLFDFVMEVRGLSFIEAVKFLAARAGITIPENTNRRPGDREREDAESRRRKELRTLALAAKRAFQEFLQDPVLGAKARNYLERRGIQPATIELFGVGYFPLQVDRVVERISTHFREALKDSGGEIPESKSEPESIERMLREIGLLRREDESAATEQRGEEARPQKAQLYSSFRDRVIFPITRSDGLAIAFGGRILEKDSDRPKYLNSPESPLYSKRQTFYGLAEALRSIRQERHLCLVEGYLDVLSMVQLGVPATLATCGTAVTPDHVRVIRRFADRVTVLFDGDAAGRKAAAGCFPTFLNSGIEVSAVLLPQDEDPNSIEERYGADARERLLEIIRTGKRSILDLYVEQQLAEISGEPVGSAALKSVGSITIGKVARRVANIIATVKNPVERELMCGEVAAKLEIGTATFLALVQEVLGAPPKRRMASEENFQSPMPDDFENGFSGRVPPPRRVRSSRTSTRTSTVAPVPERASLEGFLKQLLISILCEPGLARIYISDVPSVLGGEGGEEIVPENMQNFIRDVSNLGVALPRVPNPDGGGDLIQPELLDLLRRHELFEETLIVEAHRQLQIGGIRTNALLSEFPKAASRFHLRKEVEAIRSGEGKVEDPDSLVEQVQKKLEARRALDQIKTS